MSRQHHGLGPSTRDLYARYNQQAEADGYPYAVYPTLEPCGRHRKEKRKRVVLDGPTDRPPMFRVVGGLVVGLLSLLLLSGCVPTSNEPPAPAEVSTDAPNPTVLPPEVINP